MSVAPGCPTRAIATTRSSIVVLAFLSSSAAASFDRKALVAAWPGAVGRVDEAEVLDLQSQVEPAGVEGRGLVLVLSIFVFVLIVVIE